MAVRDVEIGIVTDEVSRDLREALEVCRSWGLHRLELREGTTARFPSFTQEEIGLVEAQIRHGTRITAVSPGILKGHVEARERLDRELDDVLPRSIELAQRFACPTLIVFGFERYEGESERNRLDVLRAFERVAEQADAAGMRVVIENEPDFWVDRPDAAVSLLEELGHPAMALNWDPANAHWGGDVPTYEDFATIHPYLANLHVKDFYPEDAAHPWRPVGQGSTPWPDILSWIVAETELPHVTLETHCTPLIESSRQSLDALRELLAKAVEEVDER